MTPAAIVIVVIFLIAGSALGWHTQKSYAAHGDIKIGKNRVRGGRRTRWRSGLWALFIAVILVIAIKDLVFGH